MKKQITIFGAILFASFILTSCGENSSKKPATADKEKFIDGKKDETKVIVAPEAEKAKAAKEEPAIADKEKFIDGKKDGAKVIEAEKAKAAKKEKLEKIFKEHEIIIEKIYAKEQELVQALSLKDKVLITKSYLKILAAGLDKTKEAEEVFGEINKKPEKIYFEGEFVEYIQAQGGNLINVLITSGKLKGDNITFNVDYDFIGDVKLKMDEFGNLDWQEALLGRKVKGVFVCKTWLGTGNESMDSPSLRVFSFNIIKELYYK